MNNNDLLYQSWMIKGSYFNRMIDCGDCYNQWVQNALDYLPRDILDMYKEKIVFISMGQKDGCRLARHLCESREIIILSERILPKANSDEGQPDVRYFIYVILHEIAHAIKGHRSPLYDPLTEEENIFQETEADSMALEWFNNHVAEINNPYFRPITPQELEEAKAKNREAMKEQYYGA